MKRLETWLLLAGVTAILAAGAGRLRLDVDVFNLLPADCRMVDGLRLYQRSFGSSRELLLSLRSPEAEQTERAARSLAEALKGSGLTPEVMWQSPFRENPFQLGEFLAYLWFNQPPGVFETVAERLREGRIEHTVENTLERLATSFRPREIALLSHDPFALTDFGDLLRSPLAEGLEDPFASPDGRFRILFVALPDDQVGFWKIRKWVSQVADLLESWQAKEGNGGRLAVRMTGTPAFLARSGSGLLRDVESSAAGTMFLVAGLFWLAHRRWLPLFWLLILLLLVLAVSVSVGALFLGPLNAASLGFGAILLGLAADYGLILYQEFSVNPSRSLAEHRAAVTPGILWAAVTTAGAFFMITRSSLPGLSQLGTLVGFGILAAAGIMLVAFLPPLVGRLRPAESSSPGRRARISTLPLHPRAAWFLTLLATVVSASILAQRLPSVDYTTRDLGPKENETMEALLEVQREIGGFDDALWLIVDGADEAEVADRLDAAAAELAESAKEGTLAGYSLPGALWPRPELQRKNRETARWLAARLPAAADAAVAAGFTEDSLRLTREAFAAWERFAAADGAAAWPGNRASQWVFRQFAGRDGGRLLALGEMEASETAAQGELLELTERLTATTGARMFSWSLLSESLLGTMQRDVGRVLLPMGAILLVMLGLAFRSVTEVTLSLVTLGLSLLCLMAFMVVLRWPWNLMNVMALPLLFGAGVDYSIHIQFALKRCGGDLRQVHRSVGRAILLCGLSTASGFGTLGFASNAGLAGLGRVCATGIVATTLLSVFLLPTWWRAVRRRHLKEFAGEAS
jgi:predicted exporter